MMSNSRKVANKKDIKEGELVRVEFEGTPVVLAMVNGTIFAMDATCSHQGGPLDEGKLDGHDLTCPWHYAVFDVRTGRVSDKTVWATSLKSYSVNVDEGTGDISLSPVSAQHNAQVEEPLQQKRREGNEKESEAKALENEKIFYEEEERKASNKLSLTLIAKEKLQGTDIMTFRFSRVDLEYAAGQYAYFRLEGVSGDPKGPIRHFSLAASPTEDYILVSTRIRDTPYKQKLSTLEDGSNIAAWGPQGEFTLQEDRPAVFLSGGIGVTPFRSMAKYATDKALPTLIVMFDSNRNRNNILYKSEFDKWAKQNQNFRVIYTVTDEDEPSEGWEGERGRIDKNMLSRHLTEKQLSDSVFYVCGPPGMIKAMQGILNDMQIPKERVKVEEFTGY